MCLDTLKKTYKKNDRILVGYKWFFYKDGYYYDLYRDGKQKLGEHCIATKGLLRTSYTYKDYETGFHAMTSFPTFISNRYNKQYSKLVLCEIHLWDIRATGYQHSYGNMAIGKNMRIVKRLITYRN